MTDVQVFFATLVGIYLIECIGWGRREIAVFVPRSGRGHDVYVGRDFYGNDQWGLFWTHPFPWLGSVVVAQPWALSWGVDGVYAYVAQAWNPGPRPRQGELHISYEATQTAKADGTTLLVNGVPFARLGASASAAAAAADMMRLRRLSAVERDREIDRMLAAATDPEAVAARLHECREAGGLLSRACTLLFLYTFVVLPAVVWRSGLIATWLPLLAGWLALTLIVVALYARAHRALYPRLTGERWSSVVAMALFPLAAIRAHATLMRHALAEFHPLAVAAAVCSPEVFASFAGAMLRDVRHPIAPACPTDEAGPTEAERSFRERTERVLRELVRDAGYDPDELAAPPSPEGNGERSYCPRCHCQYLLDRGVCEPCGGIALERLAIEAADVEAARC